jgi:hypothetical protein
MAVQKKGGTLTRQSTSQRTELAALYKDDYYTWTGVQARALREGKVSALDWENLAEEVEDLGKAEQHRLESHLESLLMHLLKWVYQPQRRSRSSSNSIREHRFRIERVLRDNPGLKPSLPQVLADAYGGTRFSAEKETAIDLSTFEEMCPWAIEDVMRSDFWPSGPPKEKEQRKAKRMSTRR